MYCTRRFPLNTFKIFIRERFLVKVPSFVSTKLSALVDKLSFIKMKRSITTLSQKQAETVGVTFFFRHVK